MCTPNACSPSSTVVIKPARSEDAALICQLVKELAEFEKLGETCKITVAAVLKYMFSADVCARAVIAWEGTMPVGFALFYRTFSTFAAKPGIYLEDLYVRPAYRRKGIGRSLITEVGKIAKQEGAARFEWTTLAWNTNARAMYSELGAREMSDWMLLRMESEELSELACCKHEGPHEGCRCSGAGCNHK